MQGRIANSIKQIRGRYGELQDQRKAWFRYAPWESSNSNGQEKRADWITQRNTESERIGMYQVQRNAREIKERTPEMSEWSVWIEILMFFTIKMRVINELNIFTKFSFTMADIQEYLNHFLKLEE